MSMASACNVVICRKSGHFDATFECCPFHNLQPCSIYISSYMSTWQKDQRIERFDPPCKAASNDGILNRA